MQKKLWAWGGGAAAVAGAVVALGVSGGGGGTTPAPRARQYTSFAACLLTDASGITGPQAAPVWAGMQDASLATHAKASYLAVAGPETEANAQAYANTLIQQRCDLVLAVGKAPASAVRKLAPSSPKSRFITVGSGSSLHNVGFIAATSKTRTAVARAMEAAVDASPKE
ncbi:BMP family ABC transporter substrate-binding protein [Streptomyces sp. NPDC007095]|uniref:BMP family ABC transporter substrate-binding protein n=1 Tax=Streptomyces sp. NPDC007095 TaxID=3154482 RepID=UPI0033FC52D2